jgi:hypothetical protein
MIKLPTIFNKRLSLKNYLISLILIFFSFLILLFFQIIIVEHFKIQYLYNIVELRGLRWFDYYSIFHYNFLPIILFLLIWVASIKRMHDSGKSFKSLLIPFANIYWLFSSGDADDNKYGSPQLNNSNNKVIFFDELGKRDKINNSKYLLFKFLLFILILINGLVINNQIHYENNLFQLFDQKDIVLTKSKEFTNLLDSKIKYNPFKNLSINGKVLMIEDIDKKKKFFFNKRGELIKIISNNDIITIFYSIENKLDSAILVNSKETIKSYYEYKVINDTFIEVQKHFKNNEIYFFQKFFKYKNIAKKERIYYNEDGSLQKMTTTYFKYDNFGNLFSEKSDNEDEINYKYDINKNLIRVENGGKTEYELEYNNDHKLIKLVKYFNDNLEYDPANKDVLTYKYNPNYNINLRNQYEDDQYCEIKLNSFMSILYIDNMYYTSNENDTFFVNRFEKDHKNNIIKVIPTEEWKQLHNGSNFEKDIFYELKKPINRKYLYYESYFDFLLNFISGIF